MLAICHWLFLQFFRSIILYFSTSLSQESRGMVQKQKILNKTDKETFLDILDIYYNAIFRYMSMIQVHKRSQ